MIKLGGFNTSKQLMEVRVMNRTTDPLIQIILEKRMRNVLAEKRRKGKSFKTKTPKPNLRDLKKGRRT